MPEMPLFIYKEFLRGGSVCVCQKIMSVRLGGHKLLPQRKYEALGPIFIGLQFGSVGEMEMIVSCVKLQFVIAFVTISC